MYKTIKSILFTIFFAINYLESVESITNDDLPHIITPSNHRPIALDIGKIENRLALAQAGITLIKHNKEDTEAQCDKVLDNLTKLFITVGFYNSLSNQYYKLDNFNVKCEIFKVLKNLRKDTLIKEFGEAMKNILTIKNLYDQEPNILSICDISLRQLKQIFYEIQYNDALNEQLNIKNYCDLMINNMINNVTNALLSSYNSNVNLNGSPSFSFGDVIGFKRKLEESAVLQNKVLKVPIPRLKKAKATIDEVEKTKNNDNSNVTLLSENNKNTPAELFYLKSFLQRGRDIKNIIEELEDISDYNKERLKKRMVGGRCAVPLFKMGKRELHRQIKQYLRSLNKFVDYKEKSRSDLESKLRELLQELKSSTSEVSNKYQVMRYVLLGEKTPENQSIIWVNKNNKELEDKINYVIKEVESLFNIENITKTKPNVSSIEYKLSKILKDAKELEVEIARSDYRNNKDLLERIMFGDPTLMPGNEGIYQKIAEYKKIFEDFIRYEKPDDNDSLESRFKKLIRDILKPESEISNKYELVSIIVLQKRWDGKKIIKWRNGGNVEMQKNINTIIKEISGEEKIFIDK